jgi:hypothetical protein
MDLNERRNALTAAMLAQKTAGPTLTPGMTPEETKEAFNNWEATYQPASPIGLDQAAFGAPAGSAPFVAPATSRSYESVNDPWSVGRRAPSMSDTQVAPGISESSFNNYHWQADPGNRSLLNTTPPVGFVPGPYSIGGLASNSFGTDPYANAADPRFSGHVLPQGGSGPPAPGYWADLAGELPYQSHGQIPNATPPTYTPAPQPPQPPLPQPPVPQPTRPFDWVGTSNPFDQPQSQAAPSANPLLQQSESSPIQQPSGGLYSGLV